MARQYGEGGQLNAAQTSSSMCPLIRRKPRFPAESKVVSVCPAQRNSADGAPNDSAWAALPKNTKVWPKLLLENDPSAEKWRWPGPDAFTTTVFPVSVLVELTQNAPVTRTSTEPSAFVVDFPNSSFLGKSSATGKPHAAAGKVKGPAGENSHFGPRADALD